MEMDDELISIYLEIKRNKVRNANGIFVRNSFVNMETGVYNQIV